MEQVIDVSWMNHGKGQWSHTNPGHAITFYGDAPGISHLKLPQTDQKLSNQTR